MFKSKNFCHIASNNRNQVKVGVFVYRTPDDVDTVTQSGYFNERIIDINLHDLIIHVQINAADNTKVQRNVLCVSQRSLDNVGTVVVKSKWEGDIEEDLAELQQYVDQTFVRKDGNSIMTGPLRFDASGQSEGMVIGINPNGSNMEFYYQYPTWEKQVVATVTWNGIIPGGTTQVLGSTAKKWSEIYVTTLKTGVINNGYDIAVPVTNSADTLALKSQVDDAANSGEQLYTTGVWYAKMYAATTVPTGAEYDGRNYADFSQVDTDNNLIIVIYEGQSGSWVELTRITPPAAHNGYMTITSKIWDIAEQSGQQGGQVLWSHNQKTFTPYPRIVSFDGANITNSTITTSTFSGTATLGSGSTMTMPGTPTNDSIITKGYLDSVLANVSAADLFDWKWRDATTSQSGWKEANSFSWINRADAQTGYNHLANEYNSVISIAGTWSTPAADANLGENSWCRVIWDGSKYIALGETGYISTSTDGVTWSAATAVAELGNNRQYKGFAYNGSIYLALGKTGYISTSADGTTWTQSSKNTQIGSHEWMALASDGNGKFVAVGNTGYVSTSTDGVNWTTPVQDTNMGSHTWDALSYLNGQFVVMGNTGYISTSADGSTWTTSYKDLSIGTKSYQSIAYDGHQYFALGYGGFISRSTDLVNWTVPTQLIGSYSWKDMVYANGKILALSVTGYLTTHIDTSAQTETIAGITITFVTAADGHKIVAADQETNVASIYSATGSAWYYIIDTANQRFKLPRSKHNKYADTLSVVGNGIGLGLTNGTDYGAPDGNSNYAMYIRDGNYGENVGSTASGSALLNVLGVTTDATKSGIIANQTEDTVQYKYLYFYVGV